jgi:hypothetical protein
MGEAEGYQDGFALQIRGGGIMSAEREPISVNTYDPNIVGLARELSQMTWERLRAIKMDSLYK